MAAIETTSGDVRKRVDMLCGHLRVNGANFGANTIPSTSDITVAIDVAAAEILAWLASAGYDTVFANWTDTAKDFISWYNALGAGYRIEMSHTGLLLSPTPGTRAETYYNMYMDLRTQIVESSLDLSDIGIPILESKGAKVSQTGHTLTDKLPQEQNTDAMQPLYRRSQHVDHSV